MAKLILKKSVYSSKFDLTFPANIELNYFTSEGKKFAEHPIRTGVYTSVKVKNIKEIID